MTGIQDLLQAGNSRDGSHDRPGTGNDREPRLAGAGNRDPDPPGFSRPIPRGNTEFNLFDSVTIPMQITKLS